MTCRLFQNVLVTRFRQDGFGFTRGNICCRDDEAPASGHTEHRDENMRYAFEEFPQYLCVSLVYSSSSSAAH